MEKFEIIHTYRTIYVHVYYMFYVCRYKKHDTKKCIYVQVHAKNAGKSINIVSCYVLWCHLCIICVFNAAKIYKKNFSFIPRH